MRSSIPSPSSASPPLIGPQVDRSRIAAPVQTASAQQIERSHALDLTSYMNRHVGSVYVNDIQNNSLQPDVNYRGYTASPLLGTPQGLSVYLDGMRLNQPFGDVVSWDLLPKEALVDDDADSRLESRVRLEHAGWRAGAANQRWLQLSRLRRRSELRLGPSADESRRRRRLTATRPALVRHGQRVTRRWLARRLAHQGASVLRQARLAQRCHRRFGQRLVRGHGPDRQRPAGSAAAESGLCERLHQARPDQERVVSGQPGRHCTS